MTGPPPPVVWSGRICTFLQARCERYKPAASGNHQHDRARASATEGAQRAPRASKPCVPVRCCARAATTLGEGGLRSSHIDAPPTARDRAGATAPSSIGLQPHQTGASQHRAMPRESTLRDAREASEFGVTPIVVKGWRSRGGIVCSFGATCRLFSAWR